MKLAALLLAVCAQGRAHDAELERILRAEVEAWMRTAPPEREALEALLREAETLDAPELFLALGNLGHRLGQLGRAQEAHDLVRWCGEQARTVHAPATRSWALEWLGQEAWTRGELAEAQRLLDEAARVDVERSAWSDAARHRADVARLALTLGRLSGALDEARAASELAERSGSDLARRSVAEVHASLLYELGRHRQALALCLAHAPLESAAVPHDEAQVRLDLLSAGILSDVGRLETAVGYARRAHELALDPGVVRLAPLLQLEAKLVLGLLLGDLGRGAEGLALLDEAEREFARLGDPRGAAWAEKNRGFVLLAGERAGEAVEPLARAWTAGAELGVPMLEALGALGTAEALAASGAADDERIERGLVAAERLGRSLGEAQVLWRVAALRGQQALARGELVRARSELAAAVEGIEAWRRRLAAGGLVEHALRARADVYRAAACAAAAAGAPEEALALAGLLQARLLDELVARRSGPLADPPSPELEELRLRLAELERGGDPAQAGELGATRAELDRRLLARDLAQGRVLAPGMQALPLEEVRRGLAEQGLELALVFLAGPDGGLVLELAADARRPVRALPLALGRRALNELVARLRAPLERLEAGEVDLAHLGFDVDAARTLHELLIAPLGIPTGARIGLLLDGDFQALPFEALVCGGALRAFDARRPGAHLAGLELLGDRHAFVRVASLARLAHPRAPRAGASVVLRPPTALAPAAAEAECAALLRALPDAHVVEEADCAALERALASAARVHVCAHGRLDPARPAHGSLLLGGPHPEGAAFEAWRAAELELDGCEVVLAACHTGRGEWHEGAGLAGLVGGFLAGGAREVVASLWAAEDHSSAALLEHYHAARTRGVPAPEALLEARLALRAAWPHPLLRCAWFVQR